MKSYVHCSSGIRYVGKIKMEFLFKGFLLKLERRRKLHNPINYGASRNLFKIRNIYSSASQLLYPFGGGCISDTYISVIYVTIHNSNNITGMK